MTCGLLGEKLGHSYSPEIHRALGDYEYRLFPTEKDNLREFLTGGGFDGINVTIPYKKDVMNYCTSLSDTAKRIGCVNTIVREKDGSLTGYNTDYYGFMYMVRRSGVNIAGKKALILGTGGASLTVRAVLSGLGAGQIVNISRRGENTYNNIEKHADAGIIVNATPVGMYPDSGVSPVDLSLFQDCRGVFDLIYNPSKTALILQAEKLGIPYENGLSMLVAQAKQAAELFTGEKIPDIRIEEIHSKLSRQMENVILIGMPGCGKTSIGQELGKLTGRPFYDCDTEFCAKYGVSAGDCIKERGQETFRSMETELLKELSKKSGCIISTGGGCVTIPENRDILRGNGTVVWVRRHTALLPTEGRPLSQAASSLSDMYVSRAPLYAAFADEQVKNFSAARDTALCIQRRLKL